MNEYFLFNGYINRKYLQLSLLYRECYVNHAIHMTKGTL